MSKTSNKFILGLFDDEDVLLDGVKRVRGAGVNIHEVFTPFPVHGLEHALGYKRSRMPVAAFIFGATGTTLALTMMYYMMYFDWPMIIGGKDFAAFPDFIPVTFELTVLLASFGMVGTFFITNDLKPYKKPVIFDIRATDDRHVMAIELDKNSGKSYDELAEILSGSGAVEVKDKTFED
ncbi:membrane protein [Fulvitalea axinellae]|uniref:Membrane protein n=1 Tax=Fulvitalea axinellae TaxID=1182444 RepID=A0AAU9CEB9_9BACT|nr:membrane protein [Fulvitalea axinellae]